VAVQRIERESTRINVEQHVAHVDVVERLADVCGLTLVLAIHAQCQRQQRRAPDKAEIHLFRHSDE
jgi:hypothetical protein